MVRVFHVSCFDDKLPFLEKIRENQTTWVVSDLRSKLEIQKRILGKDDLLEEDMILRASELWLKITKVALPEAQIYSKELLSLLIQKKLEEYPASWVHRPGTASLLYDYMTQLMPILSHPEGQVIIREWFYKNPSSYENWGEWAELSFDIWSQLKKDGIFSYQFLSGNLLNLDLSEKTWSRPLIVDLGAELTPVEAELIKLIGQNTEVSVLCPDSDWLQKYETSFSAYHLLIDENDKNGKGKEESNVEKTQKKKAEFLRFTTMIAEVKNATSQVRSWIDDGVDLGKIAILTKDIEHYWPALESHLNFEGIPLNKKKSFRYQSFPFVQQWMSELRLNAGMVGKKDLESYFFTENENEKIEYDEFVRLFSTVFGVDDLSRHKGFKKEFRQTKKVTDKASLQEFIVWSMSFWRNKEKVNELEKVIQKIYQESPLKLRMSYKDWIFFLETLLAKIEFDVKEADRSGIHCLNLDSAEYASFSHVMILGVSEQSLGGKKRNCISKREQLLLTQNAGFVLEDVDSKKSIFELDWILHKGYESTIVSYPETDFSGTPLAPSLIWLQGFLMQEQKVTQIPKESRWDFFQKLDSKDKSDLNGDSFNVDLFVENQSSFAKNLVESISATSIERYQECPFRFAAEKVFKLTDLPSLDLDVDRMTKGVLSHKLLEKINPQNRLESESWKIPSDEELSRIIDECRKESKIQVFDERLWDPIKKRYVELAKRFLEAERVWQEEFPETQTIARELPVEGILDVESGKLQSLESLDEKKLKFRGAIDRVDSDGKDYVLIDYKSTKGSLKQFGSWIENDQLQLALYAMAVEEGLTELDPKSSKLSPEVLSAVYYTVNKMDRETGFKVLDEGEKLYSLNGRSRNKMKKEEKEELFEKLSEVVKTVSQRIVEGEFPPLPKDEKTCLSCKWRSLCRANHLN